MKGSAGSLAGLVQLILEGVYLVPDFLMSCAFWGDEQAAILATRVAQEGNLHAGRVARVLGLISSSRTPKRCMDVSPST
jgi:2-phosphoglycerate kinase